MGREETDAKGHPYDSCNAGAERIVELVLAHFMAKILKGKPVPHVVIVDTNILWAEDKTPAVNLDFDKFWTEHQGLVQLELMIPEVVRGELLFQQVSSCTKILDKVTKHISEISSIAAADHKQKITHDKVRQQVTDKIDRWIKAKDAKVLPIPVSSIDWANLCTSAIWRLPPFVPDAKNPDSEKGFRDALISETVVDFSKLESRNVNIAFVCDDFVLRTATAKRLGADKRFACYESVLDFSSYIKLTRESLTNEFIKKIVKRAAEKFYAEGDPNCLVLKEGLVAKLESERSHFELPDYSISYLDAAPITLPSTSAFTHNPHVPIVNSVFQQAVFPTWKADARGAWALSPQEFQKTSGERAYHWKTTLTHARKYTLTNSAGHSGIELELEDKILLVKFNVFWKANVKDDARFHDIALESTQFDSKEFRVPTDAERQRFLLDQATPKA